MDHIGAAEALLVAGYPATSFFLSHAALEEIAKIPMLVRVGLDIVAGTTIDWSEVGKRLQSHREKIQETWVGLHINADEKIANPELLAKARKWFADDGQARALREHALYAGVINVIGQPMAFKSPVDVIDRAMAEEALTIARAIVTSRVKEEEISRGHLAHTPAGLVSAFDQAIATMIESWRNRPE